jgi:hypothetical protein
MEPLVPQPGQDPPFGDENARLDLGFAQPVITIGRNR